MGKQRSATYSAAIPSSSQIQAEDETADLVRSSRLESSSGSNPQAKAIKGGVNNQWHSLARAAAECKVGRRGGDGTRLMFREGRKFDAGRRTWNGVRFDNLTPC